MHMLAQLHALHPCNLFIIHSNIPYKFLFFVNRPTFIVECFAISFGPNYPKNNALQQKPQP
jgi:hypothetical protein